VVHKCLEARADRRPTAAVVHEAAAWMDGRHRWLDSPGAIQFWEATQMAVEAATSEEASTKQQQEPVI
jgi:hypothetical protein